MVREVRERRGSVAVLCALSMPVVLGLAALAMDGGLAMLKQRQLQQAADFTALAAASSLHAGSEAEALERAAAVLELNRVQGGYRLETGDVIFGELDDDGGFVQVDFAEANAVRVDFHSRSPGILLSLFTDDELPLTAHSVASVAADPSSSSAPCAIFAGEQITMGGSSVVDSYDSQEGPSSIGSCSASICSGGNVRLGNRAEIRVDLALEGFFDIRNRGLHLGDIIGTPDHEAPEVDWAYALRHHDNLDIHTTGNCVSDGAFPPSMEVKGDCVMTLEEGLYVFQDLVTLGNAKIVTQGAVEIYVFGDASLSGTGIQNPGELPEDLMLFVGGTSVYQSGNSDFFGHVICPDLDCDIDWHGNGDFFGSAYAGETTSFHGNADVFADCHAAPTRASEQSRSTAGPRRLVAL